MQPLTMQCRRADVALIPEGQRLAELVAYGVLDTAAEPAFDDIVRVAAEAAGCPTALVSLLDEDRQWFKARHGLDAGQTPRDQAFCEHALSADAPLVVPDATADPRFADNPLVTGAPGSGSTPASPCAPQQERFWAPSASSDMSRARVGSPVRRSGCSGFSHRR